MQRNQTGELNALLGNRVVRAFANEPVEIEKFGKGNTVFMHIKKYTYRYMAAFQITTRSFDGIMYVATPNYHPPLLWTSRRFRR